MRRLKETVHDSLVAILKRFPSLADERRTMARALRQIRTMNPKAAKFLLRMERARRARVVQEWLTDASKGELTARAYIRRTALRVQMRTLPPP